MILHFLLAICLANENFLHHSQERLEHLTSRLHDPSRRIPGFKLLQSLNQLKHMLQEMIDLNLGRWQEGRRKLTGEEIFCSSHDECPSSTPFCFEDVCNLCDECHYCVDGIDGTCGPCGDGYPTQEEGPCEADADTGTGTSCTEEEMGSLFECLTKSNDPAVLAGLMESPDLTVICANVDCFPECMFDELPGGSAMCDTMDKGYLTIPYPSCDEDNPEMMICGTDVIIIEEYVDCTVAIPELESRTVTSKPVVVSESCSIDCEGNNMLVTNECFADMENFELDGPMEENTVSQMVKLEPCINGEMETCVDGYLTVASYDNVDCSAGNLISEISVSDVCTTVQDSAYSISCMDEYAVYKKCKDDAEKVDETTYTSIKLAANTCMVGDDGGSSEMYTCADGKITYDNYVTLSCEGAADPNDRWEMMTSGTCNNLITTPEGDNIIATGMCDADYVTIYPCEVYGADGTAIDANTVTKNEDGSYSTTTGDSVTTGEFKDKEVDSSSFVSDVDPTDPDLGGSNSGANTMFALVAIIAGCWAL